MVFRSTFFVNTNNGASCQTLRWGLRNQEHQFTLCMHRQSKGWTGNADKVANVADATSVMRPDTLYFGTLYLSTVNIFQDFVFRNFKQEQQCLCNY